jgi:5-methylcytosine-specific restriction endonuclease McrA
VRYIDTSSLARLLPVGWTARAEEALAAVRVAHSRKEKAAVFTRYSDLWQKDLKLILRDLSYKKCWYCEGHDIRSDGVVDHFRPKGRVWRVPAHPGYWWLAFDPENFRYCCTLCNSRRLDAAKGTSGGKQDRFPLFDENKRAYPEERPRKEKDEVVLLDPTLAPDTLLFYFADDGNVRARFPKSASRHLSRVRVSIDIYHLDHTDLIEARLDLLNRIKLAIDLGKAYYLAWHNGDPAAKAGFDASVESLKGLVKDTAEFSSAAKDMIKGLRHEMHPWIDSIC